MTGKLDELVTKAKLNELLNKKKEEDKNRTCLLWGLAIIGAIASVAAIAYAVYRFVSPKYKNFDGEFDYDEFEDDFEDDDIDDKNVYVKRADITK